MQHYTQRCLSSYVRFDKFEAVSTLFFFIEFAVFTQQTINGCNLLQLVN